MWIADGADPIDQAALGKPASGAPDALGAANPGWVLTDGVWSLTGTGVDSFALTPAPVPLAAGVWEARARVNVDRGATLAFTVTATGTLGEALGETAPGDAVPASEWGTVIQSWTAPFNAATGSIALTIAAPVGAVIQVTDPAWAPHAVGTPAVEVSTALDERQVIPGDRIDVSANSVVAGDPDGARVEIASDGLHAYDATGTETARIQGEGGEFVGGSFRTSDNLPGRVRIADDAFTYSGRTLPGIEIIPEDTQSTVRPAGIGPWGAGAAIDGGEDTSGHSAKLHATPTQAGITSTGPTGDAHMYADSSGVSIRTTRDSDGDSGHVSVDYTGADLTATDGVSGEYGRILARPGELRMTLRDGNGNATGQVRVIAGTTSVSAAATDGREAEVATGASTGARVGHTNASGVYRRIEVTPSGFYLATNVTGSVVRTNLETLVSDVESLKARVAALEG